MPEGYLTLEQLRVEYKRFLERVLDDCYFLEAFVNSVETEIRGAFDSQRGPNFSFEIPETQTKSGCVETFTFEVLDIEFFWFGGDEEEEEL